MYVTSVWWQVNMSNVVYIYIQQKPVGTACEVVVKKREYYQENLRYHAR